MSHAGIRTVSEEEAVRLFQAKDIRAAAAHVSACFTEADSQERQARGLSLQAQQLWLEAEGLSQADGARLLAVEGNDLDAQARALEVTANAQTVQGETAWAVMAGKYGLYVPSPWRLEAVSRERPDHVWCWDAKDDELGLHPAGYVDTSRGPEPHCPDGPHRFAGTLQYRGDGRGRLRATKPRDLTDGGTD